MDIDIQYIDTADALKRVGGNKGLYTRLLQQFVDENHLALLDDAISAGDMETATREAHSIKGICANLSLPKLNAAAMAVEQKIKNNEDYSDCLSEMTGIYNETLAQISMAISGLS